MKKDVPEKYKKYKQGDTIYVKNKVKKYCGGHICGEKIITPEMILVVKNPSVYNEYLSESKYNISLSCNVNIDKCSYYTIIDYEDIIFN